jgi:hypothetical protein
MTKNKEKFGQFFKNSDIHNSQKEIVLRQILRGFLS